MALPAEEIYGAYDASSACPHDMKEILAQSGGMQSRFDEYKPEYGKTLICGYARIGGFAVGIVANQKLHAQQTDHEGHKRVEFGGVIYTESAEKAARFIMDCNQNLIPLVFFHDVNGFMVGGDGERQWHYHKSGANTGECGFHVGGAKNCGDRRRVFWRWTLRHVRARSTIRPSFLRGPRRHTLAISGRARLRERWWKSK